MSSISLGFASRQCRTCTIPLNTRHFSSSIPALVRPESPNYIWIPRTGQRSSRPPERVKGALPIPRNLFPRHLPTKANAEYLDSVAPAPSRPSSARPISEDAPTTVQFLDWKRRLADKRRQSLREGLTALKDRHVSQIESVRRRAAIRDTERKAALSRPKSEAERLTEPTVVASLRQLQLGPVADPDRALRLAKKTYNVAAMKAKKMEETKEALHTLYMNARNFITTEQELLAEIDRVFAPRPVSSLIQPSGAPGSIWDYGPPESVQSMLMQFGDSGKNSTKKAEAAARVIQTRVGRIAEVFTGGKM